MSAARMGEAVEVRLGAGGRGSIAAPGASESVV
jgi:hypothetical protein